MHRILDAWKRQTTNDNVQCRMYNERQTTKRQLVISNFGVLTAQYKCTINGKTKTAIDNFFYYFENLALYWYNKSLWKKDLILM